MAARDEGEARHRLDKWLWCTRFYKSRGLATTAVTGGRVKINGERAKASREVRLGDVIAITRDEETLEVVVTSLPERRGSATAAQACYAEEAASQARRLALREQRKLADQSRPRPDTRPDKRERRALDRLRRLQD